MDFFLKVLGLPALGMQLNVTPGFATQQSRVRFPESSYTACVHDVALGTYDFCLADMWVTPDTLQRCSAVFSRHYEEVLEQRLKPQVSIKNL